MSKRKIVNDPLTDSRGTDSVLILDGDLAANKVLRAPTDEPREKVLVL
jgi:hypothetical protein